MPKQYRAMIWASALSRLCLIFGPNAGFKPKWWSARSTVLRLTLSSVAIAARVSLMAVNAATGPASFSYSGGVSAVGVAALYLAAW